MRFLIIAFAAIMASFYSQVQNVQERHSRYMERAEVRHLANSATVTADSPRPLAQALTALSEEFAWTIDYEDPPSYNEYDLVDDTAAAWRASHPTAKGVTVIRGETFESQFDETPNAGASPAEEEHILDTVVSDYNKSTNPGRFTVRNEGDGRFAIVGTGVKDENGQDQAVSPILDTPISVQTDTRDALTTIRIILDALTVNSQTKVVMGMMAVNALSNSKVTIGGDNIPARVLLLQTLSSAKRKLYWDLLYDHDVNTYAFNVVPLRQAKYGISGNRTTVLVR